MVNNNQICYEIDYFRYKSVFFAFFPIFALINIKYMEWILIIIILVIVAFVIYSFINDKNKLVVQKRHDTVVEDKEKQRLFTLEKQYGKRNASLDKETLHVWVFNESRKVVIFYHDFYRSWGRFF